MSDRDSPYADLVRGFVGPPKAFSPTPIWWWSGDRLELGRLRWQLEQFARGGVFNLVIMNLAPTGPLVGSDADDPRFFSDAWWDMFLGVCAAARELGVRLFFYDQIGFSGANLQAGLVRDQPDFAGHWLESVAVEGDHALTATCPVDGVPLAASVTCIGTGSTIPVPIDGRTASHDGTEQRRLRVMYSRRRGFDYLDRRACSTLLDTVHGEFERRAREYVPDVVAGSFQDELPPMPTWGADFLHRFQQRLNYDLRPWMGLLWEGDTPRARRVRADYHLLRAELAEEAFFKPLFEWHEDRGLVSGCDQMGPARAGHPIDTVALYGDYMKTHRWFGAPGSDHHGDAKIHSSLAHLYARPRTWIEAFHSTGWGGTIEETFDWLLAWLRAGANLYDPHAVYYTTRGGWWEWAPPSTCWRQPYWKHYPLFAQAVARLCHLLSRGTHVCDIGILFPAVTVQAYTTVDGALPQARLAHETYLSLVGSMMWFDLRPGVMDVERRDYDVLDDSSIQRAEVRAGTLLIGSEAYRAVILPACRVLASETAATLFRFVESGGLLVSVGALPETSTAADCAWMHRLRRSFEDGRAVVVEDPSGLPSALEGLRRRVVAGVPTLHRRIDGFDILFVPATPSRVTEVSTGAMFWDVDYTFDPGRYDQTTTVRMLGRQEAPQLWNPLDGTQRRLDGRKVGDAYEVEVPFADAPFALLVWGAPEAELALPAELPEESILATLEKWQASIQPTLDNRFGDFDLPAYRGSPPVQTWEFAHEVRPSARDDRRERPVKATFGTYGHWIGPLPADELPPATHGWDEASNRSGWNAARYSLTRGIDRDRIHMSTLGPKGRVPHEFLTFGYVPAGEGVRFRTTVWMREGLDVHLAVSAAAAKRAWVDGSLVGEGGDGYLWLVPVRLRAGSNLLELELVAEESSELRAAWALVLDPARYVRPEWITLPGDAAPGSTVRFSAELDVPFSPSEAMVQVGTAFPCRVTVNGLEVGRQGGFDPYGLMMRVQRYVTQGFRRGVNTVVLEIQDSGQPISVVADLRVVDPSGRTADLSTGPDWSARRDDGPEIAVGLRRRQGGGGPASEPVVNHDPAAIELWTRPHPLPGADWLNDASSEDAVLPIVPDAFAGQTRVERFRWTLPPGATVMHIPVHGAAKLWLDGHELPIVEGEVRIPRGRVRRRTALLEVVPDPGRTEGSVFSGPVAYQIDRGPIDLGDWAEAGLGSYSGGVRYDTSFVLESVPTGRSTLDLGKVRGTCEARVNGAEVGTRIWSPYRFDVTSVLRPGSNTVEVTVYNTLAPYLHAVSPTGYIFAGQRQSGLFGPVTMRSG